MVSSDDGSLRLLVEIYLHMLWPPNTGLTTEVEPAFAKSCIFNIFKINRRMKISNNIHQFNDVLCQKPFEKY
jgi:hypothetical protein